MARLARDRKGRFLKRSRSTTALVRRSSSAPARRSSSGVRRVYVSRPAPRRRARTGLLGGGGRGTEAAWRVGTAMTWGWLKNTQPRTLAKVPTVRRIGLEGTLALGGFFFGDRVASMLGGGTVRRAVREFTDTWLTLAGYQFGRTEGKSFSIDGDDYDDLSGPLDADDGDDGEE